MKKKTTVIKSKHPYPVPIKRKPKLPKVQPHIEDIPEPKPKPKIEPKPEPNSKSDSKSNPNSQPYTQKDWQEEVAKHVTPGHPIPDWLAAKAPKA